MYQLIVDNFETGKRDSQSHDDLESAIAQLENTLLINQNSVICYIFKEFCLIDMRSK